MKILYIQKEGGIFGAEQFQLRTIPALIKRGVNIEFLRLYTDYQLGIDSPFVVKLRNLGVKVHQVNIGRFPGWRDVLSVKSIIQRGSYDIIHTHLIHADFYAAMIKKFFLPELVVVSTKHGYEESYNNDYGFDPAFVKKNLYYRLSRFSEQMVNRSFAISDGLRNFFVQAGISEATRLDRIHYGFDMNYNVSDSDESTYRLSTPQLVLAGRLVGFKGHRYALEALLLLKYKYPLIKLLIIGVGELEQTLKEKVEELQLQEHVIFLGFQSSVQAYMQHSDVVLIPSIAEGFGVVFLEAINQQKAIAAFDVAAGNEILGNDYVHLLTKPFDVSAYAATIDKMLTQPEYIKDPIIRAKERLLDYFTIDRMVTEITQFYKLVMK